MADSSGQGDNRDHLSLSDHRPCSIRKENSPESVLDWKDPHLLQENVMTADKRYRGTAEITLAPDISGTQTRINFQVAPSLPGLKSISTAQSFKAGDETRARDGHSSAGIGLVRLCLKCQKYKKEGCFDVLQRVQVKPAVLYSHCIRPPLLK